LRQQALQRFRELSLGFGAAGSPIPAARALPVVQPTT
jgi:hypothetical protein